MSPIKTASANNLENFALGEPKVASVATSPTVPANDLLVDQPSKWKNWTFWTFVMIAGFLLILYSGHHYVILLVVAMQIMVYREVISIGIGPTKMKGDLPWFRSLHWFFLASTNYFLYGESIIHYYKASVLVDAFLSPLATHHRFISFSLYCIGLVAFVLKLKKGHYRFQFSHFCWTHMALLLVVVQSHFIITNVFEGLIWFVLPASLVICNDIFAYIFGFFFGRTPLISLSPKKTWEGFIGGLVTTTVLAFFLSRYLASFPYMTCSLRELNSEAHGCTPMSVFLPREYMLVPVISGALRWIWFPLTAFLPTLFPPSSWRTVVLLPIQLHALIFALFASLIAPFGGFFASGVKRAFKIKDFSDSIPGHGGLTDRMDCQFIMGVFSSMYFHSFLAVGGATVGTVLEFAMQNLDIDGLQQLYFRLGQFLEGQGVLDA
ncbi:hypothetical protein HDV03_001314 [Kappamyces sp. JEL0829]|nr:hypothetical protein HDV03_001314 [Kappamyces sp. JEL0829]